MFDVTFTVAVVGPSNVFANYAAQDLETQQVGPVIPFTYDLQSGFVYLGFDYIPPTPNSFNLFDSQDMEALGLGVITGIPGTSIAFPTDCYLLAGSINQILNIGDDDLESYPIGSIVSLTGSFSGGGDITMGVGFLRPYP